MRGDVRNPSLPQHIARDGEINKWGDRRRMDPRDKLEAALIDAHIERAQEKSRPTAKQRPDDDELLSARQLARRFHLHVETVRRRFSDGTIPGAFRLWQEDSGAKRVGPWRISQGDARAYVIDLASYRAVRDIDRPMAEEETA